MSDSTGDSAAYDPDLTGDSDQAGDKWARRRAARRTGTPSSASGHPIRPTSLKVAFALWVIAAVFPLLGGLRTAGFGLLLLYGAFSLRSGFRGARVVLTLFGALAAMALFGVDASIGLVPSESGRLAMVCGAVLAGIAVVASLAMWHPDTSNYMLAMRRHPHRRR